MTLTKQQRKAVYKVWLRTLHDEEAKPYKAFRKDVVPGFGCVMLPFAGMWLGIESDGYTHS